MTPMIEKILILTGGIMLGLLLGYLGRLVRLGFRVDSAPVPPELGYDSAMLGYDPGNPVNGRAPGRPCNRLQIGETDPETGLVRLR